MQNVRRYFIMTFELLAKIMAQNSVPSDVKLMSDSGWECDATEMDGIFFNRKENILVFTQCNELSQNGKTDYSSADWECLG